MYVVRSGLNWDNPKIEFITENEEIALAIIEADRHKYHDDYVKMQISMQKFYKEKIEFFEFKLQRGDVLDEYEADRFNNYQEQLDGYSQIFSYEDYVRDRRKFSRSDADIQKRYGMDWFYEEVGVINDFDAALRIFNSKEL